MSSKLSVRQLDVSQKKILVRVDFNVPFDLEGKIEDDLRIQSAVPTLKMLLDKGAALVLISHLGQPRGVMNPKLSLEPCALNLEKHLEQQVLFANGCIGPKVTKRIEELKPKQVLMLENLRFHNDETDPHRSDQFGKALSLGCDAYVNDAFACCHRNHASIVDVPKYFPKKAAMGLLVENELKYFQSHLVHPQKPLAAIVGGAKVSTKMGILKSLIKKVDCLLIGGAMSHTFLKALGHCIGSSKYEEESVPLAREMVDECRQRGVQLILPKDLVFVRSLSDPSQMTISDVGQDIPKWAIAVDVGPATVEAFYQALQSMRTIFWNGPLGIFEMEPFAKGTHLLAQKLVAVQGTTIIGGGDTAAAIKQIGAMDQFDHISTGGGAALKFIENGDLIGVDSLSDFV